jgi:hypothetical protein
MALNRMLMIYYERIKVRLIGLEQRIKHRLTSLDFLEDAEIFAEKMYLCISPTYEGISGNKEKEKLGPKHPTLQRTTNHYILHDNYNRANHGKTDCALIRKKEKDFRSRNYMHDHEWQSWIE